SPRAFAARNPHGFFSRKPSGALPNVTGATSWPCARTSASTPPSATAAIARSASPIRRPPPSQQQRASRNLDVRPDFRHAHRPKTWIAGTSPTHTNSDVSLRLVYGGGFAALRLGLLPVCAGRGWG